MTFRRLQKLRVAGDAILPPVTCEVAYIDVLSGTVVERTVDIAATRVDAVLEPTQINIHSLQMLKFVNPDSVDHAVEVVRSNNGTETVIMNITVPANGESMFVKQKGFQETSIVASGEIL